MRVGKINIDAETIEKKWLSSGDLRGEAGCVYGVIVEVPKVVRFAANEIFFATQKIQYAKCYNFWFMAV